MPAFWNTVNVASVAWSERMWAVVWQSTLLVAIAALFAGLVLRRSSPSIRYWIWQILALKILLMPFWALAIPVPQFIPRPLADPAPVAPSSNVPDVADEQPSNIVDPPAARPVLTAGESPAHTAAPDPSSIPVKTVWQTWLLLGWGAVVFAQIVRLVRQRIRLGRLLRESQPADAQVESVVVTTARQLGLRTTPRAVLTETNCSPFVCGVRRAVIVLPRRLATTLTPAELRHVVLHELAHVQRRDLLWGWIGEVARVVYFFHPVVHWLCNRTRLERELACDAIAMSFSGRNAGEYAATLVRVVSQSSEPTVFKTAAASAGIDGGTK